jgi:hypothetical protein
MNALKYQTGGDTIRFGAGDQLCTNSAAVHRYQFSRGLGRSMIVLIVHNTRVRLQSRRPVLQRLCREHGL